MTKQTNLLTVAFCLYTATTLVAMSPMSIGAGALLLAILAAKVDYSKALSSRWTRIYLWLSVFLAVACIASLINGQLSPVEYGGHGPEIHFFTDCLKLWYLFWPLILFPAIQALGERGRQAVLMTWMLSFGVLSALGIVNYYSGWPRPQPIPAAHETHRFHVTLFLGFHLAVASIFIFPFFACLDLWKARWSGLPRNLLLLFAALGAATLTLTFSRTLWAALPVGIGAWILMNMPNRKSMLAAILGLVLAVSAASQIPMVADRFKNHTWNFGFNTREDLWRANFDMFSKRPLLGVGWKHNQELSGYYQLEKTHYDRVFSGHAHNNLIDMLSGTGIAGAVAWLLWSVFVFALALRARKTSAGLFASGLVCAWIAFHINGLTQVNFWDAKVTHQLMMMVAWSLYWVAG